MRSARESYTPMGHGAVRINCLGRLERANRSPVIKAEVEVKSLVKVFLCLRRVCRDRSRVGTQSFKQRFLGSEASERERQA